MPWKKKGVISMLSYNNSYIDIKKTNPQVAILGIASIEKHGNHLPVGTDYIITEEITKRVTKELNEEIYLLPTFPFGTSIGHTGTGGTIYMKYSTLMKVIKDLVESLYYQGINKVVLINNHGRAGGSRIVPQGNYITKTAVRQLNYEYPESSVIWVQPFSEAGEDLLKIFDSCEHDVHAGEIETSLMLFLKEKMVKKQKDGNIPDLSVEFLNYLPFNQISKDSVWGKPELGSFEKGEKALNILVQKTVEYIKNTFEQLDKMKSNKI